MVMKYWSAELFLKWATLVVSSLALLVACLRYPLALTLKATVQDVLRQELSRSDAIVAPEAVWEKHQEPATAILKRLERDLALIRHETGTSEANRAPFEQLINRLFSIETKLDLLLRESLREPRLPGATNGR